MVVNIVVSKYDENIDWINKVKHKVLIYDKSNNPHKDAIQLKNRGREGETFLYHIVNNYDKLDDVTVFLQGNPFEHLQLLVGWRAQLTEEEKEIVVDKMNNEINDECEFTSFYQVAYNVPNYTNNANAREICNKYFNVDYDYFTCIPSAQFIVPKRYILSRPLEFWKRLHKDMYNESINGYGMEQLWYLAYKGTMNDKLQIHDIEKERCIPKVSMSHTPYSYFNEINVNL